jgi:hypothetical protein
MHHRTVVVVVGDLVHGQHHGRGRAVPQRPEQEAPAEERTGLVKTRRVSNSACSVGNASRT